MNVPDKAAKQQISCELDATYDKDGKQLTDDVSLTVTFKFSTKMISDSSTINILEVLDEDLEPYELNPQQEVQVILQAKERISSPDTYSGAAD